MGRKFILTESQVKRLVENLDEEAAGYDDFDTMLNHGGKSMGILVDTMTDLSKVFRGITSMLRSENIEYIDLRENLKEAIDLITEIIDVMKIVFRDFTEKETIKYGEILHRKLESYQEKIRTMVNIGEELLDKERLMDRLADLTQNVLKHLTDYAASLKVSDIKFQIRLNKHKPNKKSDMN
jgi:hypothetical protein